MESLGEDVGIASGVASGKVFQKGLMEEVGLTRAEGQQAAAEQAGAEKGAPFVRWHAFGAPGFGLQLHDVQSGRSIAVAALGGEVGDEVMEMVKDSLGSLLGVAAVPVHSGTVLGLDSCGDQGVLAFVQQGAEVAVNLAAAGGQRPVGGGGMELAEHGSHQRDAGQLEQVGAGQHLHESLSSGIRVRQ
ncbi:hypothetical protein ACJWDR_00460 [Streptomyces tauricus]|uniref:hypothetical protein n=1 Tax=Streptomyces tauricus TaxID=68274 RepID=UPI00387F24D2